MIAPLSFDLSDAAPTHLTPLEFVAHQLYLQNLGGGLGPLWLTLRTELKGYWMEQAARTVGLWARGELAKQARRDDMNAGVGLGDATLNLRAGRKAP